MMERRVAEATWMEACLIRQLWSRRLKDELIRLVEVSQLVLTKKEYHSSIFNFEMM